MVVAVTVLLVMEMPLDEVINVIAVGNGLVPAIGTMDVVGVMAVALVTVGAIGRVGA
jgi:hypothetical protein